MRPHTGRRKVGVGIYREYCIREFPYLSPLDVDAREGLQDGRL